MQDFSFTASPGTYTVQVSRPTGYLLEGSTTSTWTQSVSVPSANTVVNEGVYQTASVSGTVSVGSSGRSGVSVSIADMSGDVVGTATTGEAGSFTVLGLANSLGYTSSFTLATGQMWLDENVGLTGTPAG